MADAFLFIRGTLFGLLLLTGLRLWFDYRHLQAGRMLLALLLGLAAYSMAPFLGNWPWLLSPAVILATSVPAVFWLFALAMFDDWDRRGISVGTTRTVAVLLFLGICFASYLFRHPEQGAQPHSTFSWALFYLSYLLRITFVIMALTAILAQWRQDLVEIRRRLRVIIVTITGGYILVIALVEVLLGGQDAPLLLEIGNSVLIALWVVGANILLMAAGADGLSATLGITQDHALSGSHPAVSEQDLAEQQDAPALPKPLSTTEQSWLKALQQHMEAESGYRRCDLTIGSLGEQLSIPEHLLRRLINQHLGYRNFNDYLNHYRIAEAAQCLRDPAQERLPILTIALEVGYASLTPFNRAFKAQFQQTPSEYRRG